VFAGFFALVPFQIRRYSFMDIGLFCKSLLIDIGLDTVGVCGVSCVGLFSDI